MRTRREIAEELLGCELDGEFAPCPGRERHTKNNGPRDFRLVLDGAPTGYCFHSSCMEVLEAWNLKLRQRIWFEENGGRRSPEAAAGLDGAPLAPEPKGHHPKRPPLDLTRLEQSTRGVPEVDADWFRKRSAIDPQSCGPADFLRALYEPDERVLVFTRQFSQGDYLWCTGKGGAFRLSQERGVSATRSPLPTGATEGVWFLAQPVSGVWAVNQRLVGGDDKVAKYSRRSEESVTAWRFFVLENDEAPMELWLRALAALPFPIAAIYTSGGRSVHALVRWEQPSKRSWDLTRDTIVTPVMCPLGADPAALTAVRLTRLPGCKRGAKEQKLLYLNPKPNAEEIMHKKEVRE